MTVTAVLPMTEAPYTMSAVVTIATVEKV